MGHTEQRPPDQDPTRSVVHRGSPSWLLSAAVQWLERVDPGVHRRIKGLRLVTAFGIAAMAGTLPYISQAVANGGALSSLAGGFALWASVSEGQATRAKSSLDLALLSAAAVL